MLGADDAREADTAYYRLVEGGQATVKLLGERIKPIAAADDAQIAALVEQLGHEQYSVRQKATDALARLGPLAEPALKAALESAEIEEVRMRARQLLTSISDPRQRAGEILRQLRSALVLERIGTPQAAAVLKRIAAGAPSAALTLRARECLERMGQR